MTFSQTLGHLLFIFLLSFTLQTLVPATDELQEDDDAENSPRIVEGNTVNFADYSSTVSIQTMAHLCMGSFVTNQLVLTAASCVASISPKLLRIRYGSAYHNEGGLFRDVNQTILHPDFDPLTMDNDIALLQFPRIITTVDGVFINKISLPIPRDNVTTETYLNVTGFGFKGELTGRLSSHLRMVRLRGANHATCKQHYAAERDGDGLNVTDRMICLGRWGGGRGRSICQGDIGAIAFTESFQPPYYHRIASGVASYSIGCGHRRYPNVFTEIKHYGIWISSYSSKYN